MTVKERIEARKDDMINAAALADIAARLRQSDYTVDVNRTTAAHERVQRWGLIFSLKVETQPHWSLVTSPDVVQEFVPELFKIAKDLQGIIADRLAPVIAEIEDRANKLIGPTVTIQSNGVNVEVK
jgi:hypothetical protein